jgi:hypothetical protein
VLEPRRVEHLPQCARKNGVLVDLFLVSPGFCPRNFRGIQRRRTATELRDKLTLYAYMKAAEHCKCWTNHSSTLGI